MMSRDPPSHSFVYPLFGRRWQHEPVAIDVDGSARRPLHEETIFVEHADREAIQRRLGDIIDFRALVEVAPPN